MLKIYKAIIVILLAVFILPLNVKADAVTVINDLIENAKELDGREVIIQGEVIGERMDRGTHSWINVNDGTNAIGVWLDKNDALRISKYGNYKYKGDKLIITGIFNRACSEHGGEADLHAGAPVEISEKGYRLREQIPLPKIVSVVILVPFSLFFLIYFFVRSRIKDGKQ